MNANELAALLAAPFPETELRWKPRSVSGSKALALPYLTAAAVVARLTQVLGADGWQDSYQVLASGAIICELRCRLGEAWITRQDVGVPSQQEAIKGCFSDALKRAARKFGIGLYLAQLGGQWLAYDAKTKQIVGKPQLPPWAAPARGKTKSPESGDLPLQVGDLLLPGTPGERGQNPGGFAVDRLATDAPLGGVAADSAIRTKNHGERTGNPLRGDYHAHG
jgi:hypothetical protein